MADQVVLVNELKRRYAGATDGESALAIHLFGILYAEDLAGHNAHEIAEQATGHRSYGAEIRKGMNLARYVQPKPGVLK